MPTITKRELNQRTAAVLDQVTDTDDVVVTERGKPRWRISAIREPEPESVLERLDRLEREGRLIPAKANPAPWPSHPGGPTYTSAEFDALLDEMKGDH